MSRVLYGIVVSLLLLQTVAAENWPSWHGRHANAVSGERDLPMVWSPTENVRWKAPLPGPGNSTPIVWDEHVFLTQSLDGGRRRALLAFDRSNGRLLWQRAIPSEEQETSHRQNPPCSSSPVTDGQAVYAWFGSAGLVAYDFQGRQLWHAKLGAVRHKWGNGSSPIVYGDSVIVFHGPGEPAVLVALNKADGSLKWKREETVINSPIFGTWSTPVVIAVDGHDELLLPLPGDKVGGEGYLKAYDPGTGAELWRCRGLGNCIYATPVISEAADLVVVICGFKGPIVAIRPGGRGDVTATHRVWRTAAKMPERIGTGIIRQGRLYVSDAVPGAVECLDVTTGAPLWKERVEGNLWGSMLSVADRLYITNLDGETFVFGAGPAFKLLAKNTIPEPTYAALAASRGEFFLRTHQHLYCIGKPRAADGTKKSPGK